MAHVGTCFCGAVEVAVEGEPAVMGYCHCRDCRSWSAGPINAFTIWPRTAVTVTRGEEKIATYAKTEGSQRKYCAECGGHLMTDHPTLDVTDVSAATIPGLDFRPSLHVHYQETVLPMKDGLPKFRDFPTDFGGSGETMAE